MNQAKGIVLTGNYGVSKTLKESKARYNRHESNNRHERISSYDRETN